MGFAAFHPRFACECTELPRFEWFCRQMPMKQIEPAISGAGQHMSVAATYTQNFQ